MPSSLFINDPNSFAINYGTPSYLTAEGVDYDATFTARNTDGKIDAGPTEYNALKFDKNPEINNSIADHEVAKNAAPTEIDLADVFTDRDGDAFTYSVTSNNNEDVVDAKIGANNDLLLTYATDMEGDAKIIVRGTTKNKFVEDDFVASVGYAPYVDNPVPDISIPSQDGGNLR